MVERGMSISLEGKIPRALHLPTNSRKWLGHGVTDNVNSSSDFGRDNSNPHKQWFPLFLCDRLLFQ